MVSGIVALILLLLAVIAIVVLTGKYRINAFLVLIGVSFVFGLLIGLPALDVVVGIKNGFGGTLTSIGIVIVAGTILGTILEKTGAALSMTRAILNMVGKSHAPLAMNIAGYIVSIPVFCDSGYVILNPLNKALAKESGISMTVMAVALSTGLYATHTMVPPTPGPIAAAGTLGADLGKVILLGLIAAIPASLSGLLWATKFAKRYEIEPEIQGTYSEIVKKFGKLPNTLLSFLPIVLPIVLILLKSVAEFPSKPFGNGDFRVFLSFIGDPVTALILGVLCSLLLVHKGELKKAISDWMGEGIKESAIILVITAAGGSLGAIIKASPITDFIKTNMASMHLGILLPFIISAALKTAQGSSTVAIVTTAGIMAPLLQTLGLDPALTTIAIGAGSMVVSHANDSYFWVVSQFSGMPVNTAYKAYSSATAVEGVVAFLMVLVLSLFV
ncbi:MAG TPA: GntP family permease [Rectinema sp.]|jgi:GntP family gluconate:H+ symporter|nr:GntP family permease [Treponema sp.]OQC74098.1 MAG: DsdX permease [Spirochaetes bacterium ADurb.Bin001]HNP93371.1 GntP family permease [Rectinema sp.]HNT59498.1 GntP family permease [Rectinema sp.]HNV35842.1 GntP family permease [Rectinema sp.]